MNSIDKYILEKDIFSWYLSLEEDYSDYMSSAFNVAISLDLVSNDFLLKINNGNNSETYKVTFEEYSKFTDLEIIHDILSKVYHSFEKI